MLSHFFSSKRHQEGQWQERRGTGGGVVVGVTGPEGWRNGDKRHRGMGDTG